MESILLINLIIMVTLTFSTVDSFATEQQYFAAGQQYSNEEFQDNADIDAEEDKPKSIDSIKDDDANFELESNEDEYNVGNEDAIATNDFDDDKLENLTGDIQEDIDEDVESTHISPSDYTCCPQSWIGFKNKCYKTFFTSKTWHEAQSYCLSKGHNGTLVSSVTDEINAFISGFVAKKQDKLWIGLNDIEYEGDFHWVGNNGHLHGFSKWFSGQPDNGRGEEDCVEVNYGNEQYWNDESCDVKRPYICQRDEVDECSGCADDHNE